MKFYLKKKQISFCKIKESEGIVHDTYNPKYLPLVQPVSLNIETVS